MGTIIEQRYLGLKQSMVAKRTDWRYSTSTTKCPQGAKAPFTYSKTSSRNHNHDNNRSGRDRPRASKAPFITNDVWFCDNCTFHGSNVHGSGSMTVWIERCPECSHLRCENCRVERVALKERDLKSIKLSDRGLEVEPKLETPSEVPVSITTLSPISSNRSTTSFSETFSPQEITMSVPDTESEYSESTESEESFEGDDEKTLFRQEIEILETRLIQVLSHDLGLAARLIPEVNTQLQLQLVSAISVHGQITDHGSGIAEETINAGHSTTLRPEQTSQKTSQQLKRNRNRDESEEPRDSRTPKRKRPKPNPASSKRLNFACHFFKKDPRKYCSIENRRYRACPDPRSPELRRIKDHFEAAHRQPQCERCYNFFGDIEELQVHRRSIACHQEHESKKEGIDDSQWKKIEVLLKVKRGMSQSDKEKHDIDKWWEIWDILFGEETRPEHPWIENLQIHPSRSYQNPGPLLAVFRSRIELDYERGVLPRDDNVYRHFEDAFRLALQILPEHSTRAGTPTRSSHELPESVHNRASFPLLPTTEGPDSVDPRDEPSALCFSQPSAHSFHDESFYQNVTSLEDPRPLPGTHSGQLTIQNIQPKRSYDVQERQIQDGITTPSLEPNRIDSSSSAPLAIIPGPEHAHIETASLQNGNDDFMNIYNDAFYTEFSMLEQQTPLLFSNDIDFERDEEDFSYSQMDMDNTGLTELLDQEMGLPGAFAPWKSSRDRNQGLQGP